VFGLAGRVGRCLGPPGALAWRCLLRWPGAAWALCRGALPGRAAEARCLVLCSLPGGAALPGLAAEARCLVLCLLPGRAAEARCPCSLPGGAALPGRAAGARCRGLLPGRPAEARCLVLCLLSGRDFARAASIHCLGKRPR
jgi:hypothetical protein